MEKILNERFSELRNKLKLTQKQLASSLEISQGTVTDIERGKIGVSSRVAQKLFSVLSINSDWFYTGKGVLIKGESGNELVGKIQGDNTGFTTGLNADNELSGDLDKKSEGLFSLLNIDAGSYEDNKINAYYKLTEYRLNRILSVFIEDLKRAYTSYQTLCKLSTNFGAPEFMNDKFKIYKDFDTFKREVDKEKAMLHGHVTDKKLNTCIRLVHYEEEITHWNDAIYHIISYIDIYFDLYKGKKETVIENGSNA